MLEMHGQCGQVRRLADEHHLLDRCFVATDFHDLRRAGKPPSDFSREPFRRYPEGAGDAGSARHHIADQFLLLGPGSDKMHRAWVTV